MCKQNQTVYSKYNTEYETYSCFLSRSFELLKKLNNLWKLTGLNPPTPDLHSSFQTHSEHRHLPCATPPGLEGALWSTQLLRRKKEKDTSQQTMADQSEALLAGGGGVGVGVERDAAGGVRHPGVEEDLLQGGPVRRLLAQTPANQLLAFCDGTTTTMKNIVSGLKRKAFQK